MNKIVEGPFATLEGKTIASETLYFSTADQSEVLTLTFTDGTSVEIKSKGPLGIVWHSRS